MSNLILGSDGLTCTFNKYVELAWFICAAKKLVHYYQDVQNMTWKAFSWLKAPPTGTAKRLLASLQWLPDKFRLEFKILLMFKVCSATSSTPQLLSWQHVALRPLAYLWILVGWCISRGRSKLSKCRMKYLILKIKKNQNKTVKFML